MHQSILVDSEHSGLYCRGMQNVGCKASWWARERKPTWGAKLLCINVAVPVGANSFFLGLFVVLGSEMNEKRFWRILAVISSLLVADFAQADWQQVAKLTVPDGYGGFGEAVAIDGDYAIVGAPSFDRRTGRAYLFRRRGTRWVRQAKLTPSDGAGNDKFGSSVSIRGDYAIVGAPGHGDADTGAAYVFKRDNLAWVQQAKLSVSHGGAGAAAGTSVAIDGDCAIVGAPGDNNHRGAVYIFRRNGTRWIEETELMPEQPYRRCDFGRSVSIWGDHVMVGTSSAGQDAGRAYIFRRQANKWILQRKLTASDGARGDRFGGAVSIDGAHAVAGATWFSTQPGRAYVFERDGTKWTQQAKLAPSDARAMDSFGCSVCVSGERAIVGAEHPDKTGAAYVFRRSHAGWVQEAKLTRGDSKTSGSFGRYVSISRDYAVVGGLNTESAYVFSTIP